jgi:hypothetical protein
MSVHTSSEALIRKRLEEYLCGPPHELQEFSRRHGALPVYWDMGGLLLLLPSGTIIGTDVDAIDDPTSQVEEQWQLIARVSAASKYPELSCSLPERPAEAPDCETCSGTGRFPGTKTASCGVCNGLGWARLRSNTSLERSRDR